MRNGGLIEAQAGIKISREILITSNSLVAQMAKHLPAMQETLVQSLGWDDPLEKEMATHFSGLQNHCRW